MEDVKKLGAFERSVTRRMRLLALQDRLALATSVGGFAAAAVALSARLRSFDPAAWVVAVAVFAAVIVAFVTRWFMTRASARDSAFLIDRELCLEDRLTTSHAIIERGGPEGGIEMALIEDAAGRLADARVSAVAPYRPPRRYALSVVGLIALSAALLVPERSLPGGEALSEARADIREAGEQLEQSAAEVEQALPGESITANLAKEQAELGRAMRRSSDTRTEALKKLGSLEGRIRERHAELAATRADEIVALAERRLRAALSVSAKSLRSRSAKDGQGEPEAAESDSESASKAPRDDTARAINARNKNATTKPAQPDAKKAASNSNPAPSTSAKGDNASLARVEEKGATGERQGDKAANGNSEARSKEHRGSEGSARSEAQDRLPEPISGREAQASAEKGENPAGEKSADQKDQAAHDEKPEGRTQAPGALSGFMAEQAARALPKLSEELLKKAGELRAGELKPEDIKQLQQSAERLARDLAPLAQSKELQQALDQLARQINPEQIEQVAREIMSQEKLKQELEAAARLVMQNQQARETVAGLAEQSARARAEMRERGGNLPDANAARPNGAQDSKELRAVAGGGKPSQHGQGGGRTDSRGQSERATANGRLTGRGRESQVAGGPQPGAAGEYLFLQTKAGAGAARAPYSSAYPQYRREAERSVQRSQVPPRLRSVVRNYFDAINPDARKQQ